MFMNILQRKRGSVAIRQDAPDDEMKWLGVFINDNSNPIKFGSQLWAELQDHWRCLDRLAGMILDCAYWDEYKNGGLCPFCGKHGVGQPHAVSGHIFKLVKDNGEKSMAPDPNATWHNHILPQPTIKSENFKTDGLWIEWVYVIDPKTYSLEILKAVRDKGFHNTTRAGKKWEQENYRYNSVAFCSLFNDEPDWENIETRGLNASEYYFDKAGPKKTIKSFGGNDYS